MVNYYQILKISPNASAREIKSAYRRLAKELHPDKNSDSPKSAENFALLAKAYQVLSDKRERVLFDDQLLRASHSGTSLSDDDSVFYSDNQHARRIRRMTIQRRMDAVVDRLISEERAETLKLQKAVFPTVALFVSTFFVSMMKPLFWENSAIFGKIIVVTLFIIGVLHLIRRLREAFAHYTREEKLHDSILDDNEQDISKPFTRFTAVSFLAGGTAVCFVLGFVVGRTLEMPILTLTPGFFSTSLQAELIFYPPIAVLFIDTLHSIASKANL